MSAPSQTGPGGQFRIRQLMTAIGVLAVPMAMLGWALRHWGPSLWAFSGAAASILLLTIGPALALFWLWVTVRPSRPEDRAFALLAIITMLLIVMIFYSYILFRSYSWLNPLVA